MNNNGLRPPKGAAKRKSGSSPHNFHHSNGPTLSSSSSSFSSPGILTSPGLPTLPPVPSGSNSPSLGESELQLYRVLQRANLLSYYDTFIAQGGDDVQQLCEAGEEEFLEIMALVGMSSKPLHVRRLQKALQEWIKNPGLFSMPFGSLCGFPSPLRGAPTCTSPSATNTPPSPSPRPGLLVVSPPIPHSLSSTSSPPPSNNLISSQNTSNNNNSINNNHNGASVLSQHSAPSSPGSRENPVSSPISGSNSPTNSQNGNSLDYPPQSTSPHPQNPVLSEYQIQKISQTADLIVKSLPPSFEPKLPNKKKITKELEIKNYVISMSDEDPRKMEEIRKFSAIYGRFDCKRRPQKPLTLHEVSVNEAAAQLCSKLPALLVRRDELFPLARQVVRDSGYQYSKGHSRSQFSTGFPSKLFGGCVSSVADKTNLSSNGNEAKRIKTDPSESDGEGKLKDSWDEDEMSQINQKVVSELQKAASIEGSEAGDISQHSSLSQESKQAHFFPTHQGHQEVQGGDYSRFLSFNSRSGTSSEGEKTDDDSQGVDPLAHSSSSTNLVSNILSTSGGQIIAVQNPALLFRNPVRETSPINPSSSTLHHSISTTDSPPKRRRKSTKSSPSTNGLHLKDNV